MDRKRIEVYLDEPAKGTVEKTILYAGLTGAQITRTEWCGKKAGKTNKLGC
jgi:hypothetical protein